MPVSSNVPKQSYLGGSRLQQIKFKAADVNAITGVFNHTARDAS